MSELYLLDNSLEDLNQLITAHPEVIDIEESDNMLPSDYLKIL
jgi:hypothetical protein